MTITQFLGECRKLSPKHKKLALRWVMTKEHGVMCPISAVVTKLTGKPCSNAIYRNDSNSIGLSKRDTLSIIDAADNDSGRKLRKRLIEALS